MSNAPRKRDSGGTAAFPLTMVDPDDPILHAQADEVTDIDGKLWTLALRMRATLIEHEGAALAAPQVGHGVQLVVTVYGDIVINPQVTKATVGRTIVEPEGCLSLPGRTFTVPRAKRCTLVGHNLAGEQIGVGLKGFPARLWQHECDHLAGVLIGDGTWPEIEATT